MRKFFIIILFITFILSSKKMDKILENKWIEYDQNNIDLFIVKAIDKKSINKIHFDYFGKENFEKYQGEKTFYYIIFSSKSGITDIFYKSDKEIKLNKSSSIYRSPLSPMYTYLILGNIVNGTLIIKNNKKSGKDVIINLSDYKNSLEQLQLFWSNEKDFKYFNFDFLPRKLWN